jgi:hypothetical protein
VDARGGSPFFTEAARTHRTVPRGGERFARLAYTAMEALVVLGVSDDFFRDHIAGELRWVRRGAKKLVSVRELETWLEREAARTLGDEPQ